MPAQFPNEPGAPGPRGSRKTATLQIPHPGEASMVKAAELIEIDGVENLTLVDQRIFDRLLYQAHGPLLGQANQTFRIRIRALCAGHDSTDRLGPSLERLMTTVVRIGGKDSMERVQLLGWNNLRSKNREEGWLEYAIHPTVVSALACSTTYAMLDRYCLRAFKSKYAYTLYQMLALRWRLTRKTQETVDLEGLRRQWLGVKPGLLRSYAEMRRTALAPALREVNAVSIYETEVEEHRVGRGVERVTFSWRLKDTPGKEAARAEVLSRQPRQKSLDLGDL